MKTKSGSNIAAMFTKASLCRRMAGRWLFLVAVAVITLSSLRLVNAQGAIYSVDTTSDTVISTGCSSGKGDCTLRGAIQAANSHAGDDSIRFNLPAGSVINLAAALPNINDSVSISGPGADKLTVRRNTGGDYGIFYVASSMVSVTFSGMTISNGFRGGGGGILNNNSTVNVTNCRISGNSAGDGGAGIYNFAGTMNVTNSTLSGNFELGNAGGGIFNHSGTLNVTNSTLSGNSSEFGGGIQNFGGIVNVTNCTVSGNAAPNGGGIHNSDGTVTGTVTVKSSIIASNTGSTSDVSGPFTSGGFNLIGKKDGSTGFSNGVNNDQVGTAASPLDPKLDPAGLQNNGGPTQTIALIFGSPAIDKGTSNGLTGNLTTDQRGPGFPRTLDDPAIPNATAGEGTDVGAFEVQPSASPSPTPTATPTATPGNLGNISTRLRVLNGDNALFGGMIAIGSAGKKVIIRAIGPTLTDLGLPGALQDPTLELFQGNALVGSNDDWRNSAQQAEIANSGFAPSKDAESAIIITLTPGQNYSAIVRGKNGATGIGVVEAYDLDPTATSKLGNISTRGFVDVDDNVMIAGLIVTPSNGASVKVLARALGPTLGDFGVPGFLADPTLDLVNASGTVLRSNDNWPSDQGLEIQAANLAPKFNQEAALIETLTPGQYTAIVRGSARTTGVGLVEVYNIP